jgi:transcriptional regulator GlxA family with amidase domain
MIPTRKVAVLLFDDVEVLDFAAPFEVLSVAGRRDDLEPFDVFTVGRRLSPIRARNGLRVSPRISFRQIGQMQVLVIPGGYGTREQINNRETIRWVRSMANAAEIVLSVCTGSLLLAAAGLLRGLPATTHRGAMELLAQLEPQCSVLSDQRVVDAGKIVTTGGVSAGLDGALHVVQRLTSREIAIECAAYIEYDWAPRRIEPAHRLQSIAG